MPFFTQFLQSVELADIIEILFFSTVIYYFLLWLKKDKHKNLIGIFYAYFGITILSYYAYLPTITYLLCACAPIAIIIFIVLHQETLQRNFVMLKKSIMPISTDNNWVDELIRSSITALHNNKEFIGIIERSDHLHDLIETSCMFNADIKKDIFDILIDKHVNHTGRAIWFNHSGKLVAINAQWKFNIHEEWINQEAQTINKWKQDALFITSKTDAIIFKTTPLTHSFDLIIHGKISSSLTPEQASLILKRHLEKAQKNDKEKMDVNLNLKTQNKSPRINA